MTTRSPMRCTHFTDRVRCTADATHRLLDGYGWRAPGNIYCLEHANEIINEYRAKAGWNWTMEPLDPQAARIAELEAMLTKLEWSGHAWECCPVCCATEGTYHDDDCALDAVLHKEATDETES